MKAPEAGNTTENLAGTDVNVAAAAQNAPSAADLDAIAAEQAAADATGNAQDEQDLDVEFDEYVTRAEFDGLLDRINAFNQRSSHKI